MSKLRRFGGWCIDRVTDVLIAAAETRDKIVDRGNRKGKS